MYLDIDTAQEMKSVWCHMGIQLHLTYNYKVKGAKVLKGSKVKCCLLTYSG